VERKGFDGAAASDQDFRIGSGSGIHRAVRRPLDESEELA